MNVLRWCVATTLVASLVTVLCGSANAAVKVPDDLTAYWLGSYVSDSDPRSIGEVALRVDSHEHKPFKGQLALGRHVFDIYGVVTATPPEPDRGEANPPEPDYQLFIGGATPPEPDLPGARILVRGTIGLTDPPNPDMPPTRGIKAEYLIVLADGSWDMGYLELVPAVRTP